MTLIGFSAILVRTRYSHPGNAIRGEAMNRSLFVVLAVLGLAACNTAPDIKLSSNESALISDQVHNNGTPGFFFMPPLVSPTTYGTFLPSLDPMVTIEEQNGAGVIATFTKTSGTNGALVTDNGTSFYQVIWDTGLYQLSTSLIYRIHVYLQGHELGVADVQVLASQKQIKNVDTSEYIPLVDDKKLQIRFRIQQETIDYLYAWRLTTPMPSSLYGIGAVTFNNRIYVLGGNATYPSAFTEVVFAPVLSNGNLGEWVATSSFQVARGHHSSLAVNGFLYVLGGVSPYVYLDSVEFATVLPDGNTSAWSSTTPLPGPRMGAASANYNGRIYIFGGNGWSGNFNDSIYSEVAPDGQLGTWIETTPMPTGWQTHAAFALNGIMYLIADSEDGAGDYYATINADGSLGDWIQTTPLPQGTEAASIAVLNGRAYVMGGAWGPTLTVYNNVWSAPTMNGGGLGNWSAERPLPSGRFSGGSVAVNGRIYYLGGQLAFDPSQSANTNEVLLLSP